MLVNFSCKGYKTNALHPGCDYVTLAYDRQRGGVEVYAFLANGSTSSARFIAGGEGVGAYVEKVLVELAAESAAQTKSGS